MESSPSEDPGPVLQSLRFDRLAPARSAEHYALHQAAIEWSLDAPITIQGEQDILSKRQWADRLEPYKHQIQNLITFCRRAPVTLLADDVGLGKTISAGLILSELMVRRKVERVLIVAPKLLLPQWAEELAVKFGIPSTTAVGSELKSTMQRGVPAVITTYHSLRGHLDKTRDANFDMLVLDEAHKLRNLHGTARPPQFAVGIRSALADRVFKYVLMLTATPIQNRLWDLYSLIDLLTVAKGHANPFGPPSTFKSKYIEDSRAVRIREDKRQEFRRHLGNYIVRTRRSDARLVFPARQVRTYRVKALESERRLLQVIGDLFSDSETKLNGLAQSSIGQALMSSPRALVSQVRNMGANGNIPTRFVQEVEQAAASHDLPGKAQGLLDLLQELASQRPEDWRVVVFTGRTQTQEMIGELLERHGISHGFIRGARARENEASIRRFRSTPPGIRVLVSTDAGAEGVNLQVANVLVNYDLPWNPMVLEQRIGRVQRLASKHAEVIILNLVLKGSVEEAVVARLSEKLQAVSQSLGDIEAILESASMDDGEGQSFETLVRNLVVDSLRGLDVIQSTAAAEQSIEEAKRLFDEERETVERTLGNLTELHRSGPRIPKIEPISPSIESRDFVLRAHRAEGGAVRVVDSKLFEVSLPGQHSFQLTFDEQIAFGNEVGGVFGHTAPKLFVPGKRNFERLAQSWSEKAGALIADRTQPDEAALAAAISEALPDNSRWELSEVEVVDRNVRFAGALWCRATIANEVDRLEKLVRVRIGEPDAPDEPLAEDVLIDEAVTSIDVTEDLKPPVADAVCKEPDLCKFVDFYMARLLEELPSAVSKSDKARLAAQFTPSVNASVVGLSGVRSARLTIDAAVLVETHGPFKVRFSVYTDELGALVAECSESMVLSDKDGQALPASAVAVCSCSGKRVAQWHLVECAETQQLAMPEFMAVCSESGEMVMPSAVSKCEVTGRTVRRSLLQRSDISGRLAVASELRQCQVTGVSVLPEELIVSEVTGRLYRHDKRVISILTDKSGHASEFVESSAPNGPIEHALARQSDVSGLWGAASTMVESGLSPGRWGLPQESATCVESGRVLLCDEAERSDVSGMVAEPSRLLRCEVTGAKALESELAKSEVSGARFRKDQATTSVLSGRSGHRSEFIRATVPVGWIAKDEAVASDVSGELAATALLVASEKPPFRKGLPGEVRVCEISGKRLLQDEVAHSAVSGKIAESTLLVPSAASGRLALPEELETCEWTGARVCPDEVARCAVSGKLVDARVLATSELSGKRGIRELLMTCAETKRLLLPSECARCEMSGEMVGSDFIGACSITGRRVRRSLLAVVPSTGQSYIQDDVTRAAVRAKTGSDKIVIRCDWTGADALAINGVVCRLSGLGVTREVLNTEGEISEIRALLDGHGLSRLTALDDPQLAWLRTQAKTLQAALSAEGVIAPGGAYAALCVRCKGGLLNLGNSFVFVLLTRTKPPTLHSAPVRGRRHDGVWRAIEGG